MNDSNVFLLSWDMHGLEAVVNVTAMEQDITWNTLQDKPTYSLGQTVNAILFRARANSQRHYEVYTVTMEGSITEEDIHEMFESAPQHMADLIRERGRKVYSDRYNEGNKVKIV